MPSVAAIGTVQGVGRLRLRLLLLLAPLGLLSACGQFDTNAGAAPVTTTTAAPYGPAFDAALSAARVEDEHHGGYRRELFAHWLDADGDSCDTRDEVLMRDSLSAAQIDPYRCRVLAGDWVSVYDGATWTDPAELQIDHVVALSEAWASGAWAWDSTRRAAFANDLGDRRSLVAVTGAVNGVKGDGDPAEWLPALGRCAYLESWVAVKLRWDLSFDVTEVAAIRSARAGCPDVEVTFERATSSTPATAATSQTSNGPGEHGALLYATCAEVRTAGRAPLLVGQAGYRVGLDGDGDGIACE